MTSTEKTTQKDSAQLSEKNNKVGTLVLKGISQVYTSKK